MNAVVCVSLNPRAERFASVIAGDLIVKQRTVFQEYPAPQILKGFSKLPNAKMVGLSAQTPPPYFGEQ